MLSVTVMKGLAGVVTLAATRHLVRCARGRAGLESDLQLEMRQLNSRCDDYQFAGIIELRLLYRVTC